MHRLTDSAARAKNLLERENAPLAEECERVLARDLERVLSSYFFLQGGVQLKIAREGNSTVITLRAEAVLRFSANKKTTRRRRKPNGGIFSLCGIFKGTHIIKCRKFTLSAKAFRQIGGKRQKRGFAFFK